jgi:type I restriction-modification system DNA methylase subunit
MESYKEDFNCDIFTPDDICLVMQKYLKDCGSFLEPSCGTGNLLKGLDYSKYTSIDLFDIKQEYLDKCPSGENIRKFCKDFLKADINTKYDNIIMNPPYIRFQNLPVEYRDKLKQKWEILSKGNIDIYYAFIIKCLELLTDDGVLIVICPNSYLYNKSAKKLREYILTNKFISEIIDFGHKKVFENVSTYCCISVFTKSDKQVLVYNNSLIHYENITDFNIFSSKSSGLLLGDICDIRNGVATLCDKIFVHDKKKYNEECWEEILCGNKKKFIIFPYKDGKIIPEEEFKTKNSDTFKYLETKKEILNSRDKGKKIYHQWYSFGRTQSLVVKKQETEMLFIPVLNDPDNFKIIKHLPCLFKNCLSVNVRKEYEDVYNCEKIEYILKENIHFLTKNCPKRSSGWLGVSSSVLKSIPV